MKAKNLYLLLALVFCLGFMNTAEAQRCDKLQFFDCTEDPGDFDFRSQSKVAGLSPGDTITTKMAVYSNQRYRFMVCADPDLGLVEFQVYSSKRRYRKIIKDIKTTEEVISEQQFDDEGNEILDDNWNPVYIEKKVVTIDTIWATEAYYDKKTYFDSNNSGGKTYMDKEFKKPTSVVVKIIVPPGDPDYVGCVNLLVGRKSKRSKSMSLYSSGREG